MGYERLVQTIVSSYDKETNTQLSDDSIAPGTKGLWCLTYTGHKFYGEPDNFFKNVYDIEDMAESLSKKVRWGGHCNGLYTVAQHSVLVARITPHPYKLEGLLHDMTETYLGDIPRPIKAALAGVNEYEDTLYRHMARSIGVAEELPDCVKDADNILLVTEARDLMNDPVWAKDFPQKPLLGKLEVWEPAYAKNEFLSMYYELAFNMAPPKRGGVGEI